MATIIVQMQVRWQSLTWLREWTDILDMPVILGSIFSSVQTKIEERWEARKNKEALTLHFTAREPHLHLLCKSLAQAAIQPPPFWSGCNRQSNSSHWGSTFYDCTSYDRTGAAVSFSAFPQTEKLESKHSLIMAVMHIFSVKQAPVSPYSFLFLWQIKSQT